MKRSHWLIAAIVVATGIGIYYAANHDSYKKPANTNYSSYRSNYKQVSDACSLFTIDDAKKLLGDNIKKGNSQGQVSNQDTNVSTCLYVSNSGNLAEARTARSASLLARAAKTGAGITANQNEFGAGKPMGAQHVKGYGDNAFWAPQYGQLNILKHNNWYILANGTAVDPSKNSLDDAKKMADLIIDKL